LFRLLILSSFRAETPRPFSQEKKGIESNRHSP
jgi:hypothetical protein